MMSFKHELVLAVCGAALSPLPALCHENVAYKSDVSVGAFLPVGKSRTSNGAQESDADLNIHRRPFVRAEYRGIFCNSPRFSLNGVSGLDRSSVPALFGLIGLGVALILAGLVRARLKTRERYRLRKVDLIKRRLEEAPH